MRKPITEVDCYDVMIGVESMGIHGKVRAMGKNSLSSFLFWIIKDTRLAEWWLNDRTFPVTSNNLHD